MGFADVNYLAVGLAAVLSFALGMLWYSPLLFAKAWMAGQGYTEADLERMQSGMGADLRPLVRLLVRDGDDSGRGGQPLRRRRRADVPRRPAPLARVLGHRRPDQQPLSDKPLSLWAIDAGYQVASIGVMAVVIGLWR